MTVLVGFVPTPEGEAAFAAGLAEARRRQEGLLVLNTPRGGAPVSADVAPPELVRSLTSRSSSSARSPVCGVCRTPGTWPTRCSG